MTTSISCPFFTISPGCLTFLVQERSEMWTNPSIPSSSSTKAPKGTKSRTTPLCLLLTAYFSSRVSHGSGSICFIPREIFLSLTFMLRTTASISSPMESIADGCLICCVQDISETWIRPSTPFSSSMNAP